MSDNVKTAILAGGCAWIMQPLLAHPYGVISTRVGWIGGEGENPTEKNPGGHAEAVEVTFDPRRISYRSLLEYFFQVHRPDPTSARRWSAPSTARRSSTQARSSAGWPRR